MGDIFVRNGKIKSPEIILLVYSRNKMHVAVDKMLIGSRKGAPTIRHYLGVNNNSKKMIGASHNAIKKIGTYFHK